MVMKEEIYKKQEVITYESIDLDDFWYYPVATKNSKPPQQAYTVKQFIEILSKYDQKATIQLDTDYEGGYGCVGHSLSIQSTRMETDEEFEYRVALLKEAAENLKKNAKIKKSLKNEKEIELYKSLHKKYKGKV